MKRIKTCVIGVGFIGAVHIEALRRLGFVDVVALSKRNNAEESAQSLGVPHAYSDYKEMIDTEKPDVVHICTPNHTHFEMASYALERGIHVLCEKPLTYTVEEAEKLTALAEEKGLINGVNLHCRHYPMVREMKELIAKKEIGEVFSVNGGYFQDWLLYNTDYSWRLEKSMSGSTRAVADIGSHWIDAVEFVTGLKISRVMADFGVFHKTRKKPLKNLSSFANKTTTVAEYEEYPVDTEDYAQVLMEFENGAKGNMIVSQAYAGRKNQMIISVAGSEKTLTWDSEESINSLWIGERSTYNHIIQKDPSLVQPGTAGLCAYPGGHAEGFADAFVQNFKSFYNAVLSGTPGMYATFKDGAREMVVCEAIARSAAEERWIRL